MTNKQQATMECITLALQANGPMTIAELICEVRTQAYMSAFALALNALRLGNIVHVEDDGTVEII